MNKKIVSLCSAVTIALLFSACGSSTNSPKEKEVEKEVEKKVDKEEKKGKEEKPKVKLVGRVIDGYIKDSTVFFDLNGDLKHTKDEPKDTSDEYGRYTLEFTDEQAKRIDGKHSIVALGDGVDMDTNKKFEKILISTPYKEDAKNPIIVNPLSTFLTKTAKAILSSTQGDGISILNFQEEILRMFDNKLETKNMNGMEFINANINYIKDNNLNYYKINNILQKALEISGASYEELASNLEEGISLDEFLDKLDNAAAVKNMKEFYSKITQVEMEEKKRSIARAVAEKIENQDYTFTDISIADLAKDEEISDVEDEDSVVSEDEEDEYTPSEVFEYSDLVDRIFSMHRENGDIFMFSYLKFSRYEVNTGDGESLPYSIENGILKLRGMSFEKVSQTAKRIYFKQVDGSAEFYLEEETQESAETIANTLVEQKGFVYSAFNKNATVFIDKNKNLKLDADEKSTTTDADGKFSIEIKKSLIEKRKSLVAINGKNSNEDKSRDILFATTMQKEGNIYINTFSSFLTSLAYAITDRKIQRDEISHSNMIPSLGATLGITVGDNNGTVNQIEADTTKDVGLNEKAKKLNAYVRAIANTYNSEESDSEKILEAYIHLIANAVSNTPRVDESGQPVDETGIVKLIERFNQKNNMEKNGETFANLLSQISSAIENNEADSKIEALIEKAKMFQMEAKPKAKAWEVSASGEVSYDGEAALEGELLLPKDQFSKYQWHIKDQGAVVNTHGIFTTGEGDLGVMELYKKGYVGKNAHVRVVDDGVEYKHEDLQNRISLKDSYNAQTKEKDPTSPQIEDSHGTNVAGLIAADGSNRIGLRGVAPYATLSAYKLRTPSAGSLDYNYEELTEAWLGGSDDISIVNNSWGSTIDKYIEEEKLLEKGATTKRGGKGRIYLIAAGNGGFNQRDNEEDERIIDYVDDSVTSYFRGSQYAITVAAIRNENIMTQYTTQGSNVLVSGYGGGIKTHTSALMGTTTRTGASRETWEGDKKRAYSFTFDGTSAATPVTSGALALVLSECPYLSYRDVKWLIAQTSKKVDENYDGKTISGVKNVPSFKTAPIKKTLDQGFGYIENGASNYYDSSKKLSHSNYYGYGLINPAGMIEKCKSNSWKGLPEKRTVKVVNENTSLTNLKDSENHLITEKIMINANDLKGNKKIDKIEWVGLTVYGEVDNLTKISMVLISPSGTISRILTNSKTALDSVAVLEEGYRFSSVAFVDENPQGEWTLLVQSTDDKKIDTGRLMKLELEVVGYNSEDR